jgi:hypothetical protein
MVADDLDYCAVNSCTMPNARNCTQHTFLEKVMPEVEVWTTVDVELDDFADEDLLDELERRGLGAEVPTTTATELIRAIYDKRRLNRDYQQELEQLIYQTIGKIV